MPTATSTKCCGIQNNQNGFIRGKCYDFKNQGSIVRGRDLRLEGNQGEKDGVEPEMERGELMLVSYSE